MKRIRSIMLVTILLLSAMAAMAVFAGTAAADDPPEEDDPIRFYGTITDGDGSPYAGHTVEIKKKALGSWRSMGTDVTDVNGEYAIGYTTIVYKRDTYRLYIDDTQVAEQYIDDWTYDGKKWWCTYWSYGWDHQIPEFATIAIPVVAILGLVAFYRRKQKK